MATPAVTYSHDPEFVQVQAPGSRSGAYPQSASMHAGIMRAESVLQPIGEVISVSLPQGHVILGANGALLQCKFTMYIRSLYLFDAGS